MFGAKERKIKMKNVKKIISLLTVLCILLTVSVFAGCADNSTSSTDSTAPAVSSDTAAVSSEDAKITITVTVINGESKKDFTIKTSADNLADALLEEGLADGTTDTYGLFITTVDGYTADYDKNGEWWGIKDGEGNDLMTGASSTEIKDGDSFQLVLSK